MATTAIAAVRVRLRRELDAAELALAVALLDEVENRLRANPALGDVDARLLAEPVFAANFTATAANAVVRVLVNPDGYRQESIGPYGWTYDTRAAAGFLTVLEEELALLAPAGAGGAFTIAPSLPPPAPYAGRSTYAPYDPLSPGGSPYWGDLS